MLTKNKLEMKFRKNNSIHNRIKYNKICRNKFSEINVLFANWNSQFIAQRNKMAC